MSTAALHIVFAGGGTAGHLFPGLAVAAELAKLPSPPRITFAGGGKSFESKRVTEAGFEYFECACAPLPRGVGGWLRFATKNFAGKRAAKKFLRRENVNLVVGMGGYVSVPMARAAVSTHIPLVLMEQNAYPRQGHALDGEPRRANLCGLRRNSATSRLRRTRACDRQSSARRI